jgi:hypothetical protein
MLEFGYILLIIGCALRIWLRLSAKHRVSTMSPQAVILRNLAISDIKHQNRRGLTESGIMIATGFLIILITGLFN